jgi:hypothetical protein
LARTDKDGAAPACHICDRRRVRERAEDAAGLDARASTDFVFTGREERNMPERCVCKSCGRPFATSGAFENHDCVQALADLSLEQLLARYREEQKRPKGTTTKH